MSKQLKEEEIKNLIKKVSNFCFEVDNSLNPIPESTKEALCYLAEYHSIVKKLSAENRSIKYELAKYNTHE